MKQLLLFISLLLLPLLGFSQDNGDGVISVDSLPSKVKKSIKPELHFTAGTSLMIMPKYGAALSHFVAPELTFRLSDRARIKAGLMLSYNSMNTISATTGEARSMAPYYTPYTMRITAYVAGEYDINEKLTVTGSLFTDMMQFDASGNSGMALRNSVTYGGTAGLRLKLSEHSFIEAQVQMRYQTNPYPALPQSILTGETHKRIGPWDSNW